MAKGQKNKSPFSAKKELENKIIDFYNKESQVPYNYKQVSAGVGAATPKQRSGVVEILEELALEGFLIETTPGKFKATTRTTVDEGIFVRRSNGKNSVVLSGEDGEKSIFVAERNSMHALNGDKVKVHICAQRRGCEPEAEVIEVIEKNEQVFIGTLQVEKYYAHLITDSKFLATDIFIPKNKLKGGLSGDKAIVKIVDWPDDANSPVGEVVDVLGTAGDNNAEIHGILAEYGLPYKYPENVTRAADKISDEITDEEVAKRKDFRKVVTFTIDPKDAKDFDDALSIQKLANGHWQVGIHIADVTHYVTPGSVIDKEAYKRATSVYLVDRTVPMLPERLCNGVCSLRPNEEKLAFSCIVEMDNDARIYDADICRTVIKSDRRFTYEEAQDIIETGQGEYSNEILALDHLAKILRKERFENGSVEFDRCEVRFDIDENGRPVDVFFKVSKDANKLVEEFMLLANKKVAERIGIPPKGKKAKAFVYRIHDVPNPDKLQNLSELVRTFGMKIKTSGKASDVNKSLNKMLHEVKGRGEENLLSTLAIRSMAKAIYSTVNIGHYGLAFDYYTHFTSPIRRYPDMMVHRLLEKYLSGGRSVNAAKLEEECKHSSDMEQLAASAERASIKYKQVEYLGERLGKVYEGTISGVTEWGLYVEIDENKCEGLVPIRDLEDDYYEFDEKNYRLIGRRTHRRYQLGDSVTIQIARADLVKKQLDFALIDEKHPAGTHRIDKEPITQSRSKSSKPAPSGAKPSKAKKGGKSTAKKNSSKKKKAQGKNAKRRQ